jgi:acetyl-CoA C-acetyltransferase
MTHAYIVEALRTAGGRRGGALKDWHPADLGAAVLDALVGQAGIDPAAIEDVIVGCVSQAGEQSFHVGRNMVLASALPDSVPAVTIDRQCGSSQQALHFAAQAVMSGTQDIVIAAGVESMSRVPMGIPTILAMQAGIGTGPWSDAIKNRYGVAEFSQFTGAEMMVDKYGFDRATLDAFAVESHAKAAAATDSGAFEAEIVPLAVDGGVHERDEGIRPDASTGKPCRPQDDRAGRPDYCRQCKPDLRRRIRRAGGVGDGPEASRADAIGTDRQSDRDGGRPR